MPVMAQLAACDNLSHSHKAYISLTLHTNIVTGNARLKFFNEN